MRSKAERYTRIFFSVYLFGMLFWQFTSVMVNFSREAKTALFWYNLLVAGSGTFTVLFFPFTRAFAQDQRPAPADRPCVRGLRGPAGSGFLGIQFQEVTLGRRGTGYPCSTAGAM